VLASKASLVEIDLLRTGEPTVACPVERLPAAPYWDREHREVYPAQLRERLPRFAVPLREDLDDVALDLPALLAQAYENAGYARSRADPAAVPRGPGLGARPGRGRVRLIFSYLASNFSENWSTTSS
jgi:hypothetical protein